MREQGKSSPAVASDHHHQPPPHYGTFQGVPTYYPQPPAMGFPHPVPPSAVTERSPPPSYSAYGYQTVPGYAIAEGRPIREYRLPCCGLGVGWFLFIIGFFFASIPWYIGALFLLFGRNDYREKPGFIACTVAAIVMTIAIILGARESADDWW